jgi:hypothetical protein
LLNWVLRDTRILARASLARTATLLTSLPPTVTTPLTPISPNDLLDAIEQISWGHGRQLRPAAAIKGTPMHWEPARNEVGFGCGKLGSARAGPQTEGGLLSGRWGRRTNPLSRELREQK